MALDKCKVIAGFDFCTVSSISFSNVKFDLSHLKMGAGANVDTIAGEEGCLENVKKGFRDGIFIPFQVRALKTAEAFLMAAC